MTFRGNYFEGNLSFNAIIRINAYLSRHRSYRIVIADPHLRFVSQMAKSIRTIELEILPELAKKISK